MQKFVRDYPKFRNIFKFQEFNAVQLGCFDHVMNNDDNLVVSAPTSSGKTVIFQLALIKKSSQKKLFCLYLAPIKSLCHEKYNSWGNKFKGMFTINQLTSDSLESEDLQIDNSNILVSTPEKIDFMSRKNLNYLKKINLLLVDQIHMLNLEERGGLLEALISRIMSINQPRILAVSATIPNVHEISQWLRVPKNNMCIFGDEYRPVPLKKVVLGFKSGSNPFLFEKTLNYKLLQVVRSYSHNKCSLVFCQTQKGTESACQQIISDMKERQFIDNDKDLLYLIQQSKSISNSNLQMMVAQGVGFHNAGLNLNDRTLVQKLFLQSKIKVLCTTSTLAMGVNLPARLVVIKSTQCYRGSGKGYQQYTQIQLQQMMGRAGRIPFDNQGTVVIMTESKNYNKYLNLGKLQILQSHLYEKLCEHLNAQIMMNSISCFNDALKYFENSFCYIRMKNSPLSYGIKGSLDDNVKKFTKQALLKLRQAQLINYSDENQKIVARSLGINVAKNYIQIDTICLIMQRIKSIKSQKDFLLILCQSHQLSKFRNKLDQRKLLKQINDRIQYQLKTAISTPEKKAYVIIQAYLSGINIDNWQIRKQAKQIAFFLRRLTYCIKSACYDKKIYWGYYLSSVYLKYLSNKFNTKNEQMIIKQFPELNNKWKMLSMRGVRKISQIIQNVQIIDSIDYNKNSQQTNKTLKNKLNSLKQSIMFKTQELDDSKNLLIVQFIGNFDSIFRNICVVIGEQQSNEIYMANWLTKQNKLCKVAVNKNRQYYLAVIKQYFIGFDQFYIVRSKQDVQIMPRKVQDMMIQQKKVERKQRKSLQAYNYKNAQNNNIKNKNIQKNYRKQVKKSKSHQLLDHKTIQITQQPIIPSKYNRQNRAITKLQQQLSAQNITNKMICNKKVSRKKSPSKIMSDQSQTQYYLSNYNNYQQYTLKKRNYIPLNQYKCWKPGFPAFQCQQQFHNRQTIPRKLKITGSPSKKKNTKKQHQIQQALDPYQYFYNLF